MFDKKEVSGFLNPGIIAVIGASENPEKVGYILMKKLENFHGRVIPINPKREFVLGKKSYSSVKSFNGRINLAVIATPPETVEKIIEECGHAKIKNVIIITAGFAETGNNSLQERIINKAKKLKINVLGPNCFGVANPHINLDTTFSKTSAQKGDIAFIGQSGALWSYLSDFPEIGFSGYISLGNMADLEFNDFIKYFSKDPKTKKIVLYIEKLKNGREFIKICRESKKEIIAIKVGKSKQGSKAAISHTASLATDYNIYSGAFKQAKIKVSDSIYKALNPDSRISFPLPDKKNKSVIITNAGGAGALISDLAEEHGFDLIKLPIDILGTATSEDYKRELNKAKECQTVMVVLTPQEMSNPEAVAQEIADFKKKNKDKRIIAFFLGEKSMKKSNELLKKNKIEFYNKI